jgi:hypothetical protein
MRYAAILIVVLLSSSAFAAEAKTKPKGKANPLVATTFASLQSKSIIKVVPILPKKDDVIVYLQKYMQLKNVQMSEEKQESVAKKEVAKTIRKVQRQIIEINQKATELGIDLSKSTLVSATTADGKPYVEDKTVLKADIYLTIKQADKSLVVILQDCIYGVKERKLGDGFILKQSDT